MNRKLSKVLSSPETVVESLLSITFSAASRRGRNSYSHSLISMSWKVSHQLFIIFYHPIILEHETSRATDCLRRYYETISGTWEEVSSAFTKASRAFSVRWKLFGNFRNFSRQLSSQEGSAKFSSKLLKLINIIFTSIKVSLISPLIEISIA